MLCDLKLTQVQFDHIRQLVWTRILITCTKKDSIAYSVYVCGCASGFIFGSLKSAIINWLPILFKWSVTLWPFPCYQYLTLWIGRLQFIRYKLIHEPFKHVFAYWFR